MLRFLLLLAAALLVPAVAEVQAVAGAEEPEHGGGLQLVPAYPPGSLSDVLVVTLLDGHVVALDHASGRILWTFDSGAPLVSARQSDARRAGFNVFPGTDGGLYAYNGLTHLNPGLERLPISLPELVEAAPSLTADGSLIMGRRDSKVFLLDRRSGRVLHTLSNAADALEDRSSESLGLAPGVPREHLLFLGRQDYIVRSVRLDSKAETWNATFSKLYTIPPNTPGSIRSFLQGGLAAPPASAALGGGVGAAAAAANAQRRLAELPRLVVGSDNSLQAYDSRTLLRKWYVGFDTPPVSAYRQDGLGGNCLDPEQASATWRRRGGAGLPPGAGAALGAPGHKVKGRLAGGTSVLVGALHGSLYALPADHLMLEAAPGGGGGGDSGDADGGASGPPAVWPRRSGRLPLDITPAEADMCHAVPPRGGAPPHASQRLPSGAGGADGADGAAASGEPANGSGGGGGGGSSSALALVDDAAGPGAGVVALQPSDAAVVDELGLLTCPQPPLGIHPITVQAAQTVAWLPEALPSKAAEAPPAAVAVNWASLRTLLAVALSMLLMPLGFGLRAYQRSSRSKHALAASGGTAPLALPPTAGTAAAGVGSPAGRKPKKGRPKHKAAGAAGANGLQSPPAAAAASKASSGAAAPDQAASAGDASQGGPPPLDAADAADAAASAGPVPALLAASSPAPSAASPVLPSPAASSGGAAAGAASPTPPSVHSESGSASAGAGGGEVLSPSSEAALLQTRSHVAEDGAVVIGRLRVGPGILGYGSAGTIVYEGQLDARPVAVKRLLRQFYRLARKEIAVLVVSDEHPNVVRCFAMEEDREFVYLALERCKTSLADTMASKDGPSHMLDPATGAPTPWCLSVLSDVAAGLAALHARGIVHRDLKPHNVLLTRAGTAKLSDMGLSKQLVSEQSSFESHGSGGSSGWQAPEQLIARDGGAVRQSRAMDVFSLGCVMFYCLTGGRHPFGETYERDTNILRGAPRLEPLARSPEAANLLAAMLCRLPGQRPTMAGVLAHPFWWSDDTRLQFLVDVSDRVENEDREPDPTLLMALESAAPAAVGANWGASLDVELITNLGKYRRYDYTGLRDLLRVVRNKRNHFREMPDSLQALLGPLPGGYYRYFAARFPNLLLAVFFFALQHLSDDANLAKYWAQGRDAFVPFTRHWNAAAARAAARAGRALPGPGAPPRAAQQPPAGGRAAPGQPPPPPALLPGAAQPQAGAQLQLQPPPPPPRPASQGGGLSAAGLPVVAAASANGLPSEAPSSSSGGSSTTPAVSYKAVAAGGAALSGGGGAPAAAAAASVDAPQQPGQQQPTASPQQQQLSPSPSPQPPSPLQLPPAAASSPAAAAAAAAAGAAGGVIVGYRPAEVQDGLVTRAFPSRPGKTTCDFYTKTGHCRFGQDCVFDHPPEFAVPLTDEGLPFRPDQPVCTFYNKTRQCKFGAACKFHHPKLVPIFAGSALPPAL